MRKICLLSAVVLFSAACALPSDNPNAGGSSSPLATPPPPDKVYATTAQVVDAVAAAQSLAAVPDQLAAAIAKNNDEAGPRGFFSCRDVDNPADANPFGQCAYGDKSATKTMVIYGDSRSAMWAAALEGVAAKNGYQLRAYGLGGCPVVDLQFMSAQTDSPNTNCDTYHQSAIKEITALKPDLIVVTSVSNQKVVGGDYATPDQWRDGWTSTLDKLKGTGAKLAMIGDIPKWQNSDARCLAAHMSDAQACSAPADEAVPKNVDSERAAADSAGVVYVPVASWVCADKCEPVIADQVVYNNIFHFTQSYTTYLTGALGDALSPVLIK